MAAALFSSSLTEVGACVGSTVGRLVGAPDGAVVGACMHIQTVGTDIGSDPVGSVHEPVRDVSAMRPHGIWKSPVSREPHSSGCDLGQRLTMEGLTVGSVVGGVEGATDGALEGAVVGGLVGVTLGLAVGAKVGLAVGARVGSTVAHTK